MSGSRVTFTIFFHPVLFFLPPPQPVHFAEAPPCLRAGGASANFAMRPGPPEGEPDNRRLRMTPSMSPEGIRETPDAILKTPPMDGNHVKCKFPTAMG